MISNSAKSDHPLVSVVITCYNCESTIFRAIKSVTDQSYRNLQIIVVDDFSSDQSREIVASILDPRCELISMSKNSGVSAARNAGYQHANGEFITQLDGDDYLHADKIANEVTVALQNFGASVFSRYVVTENDRKLFKFGDILLKSPEISYLGILYRTEYTGRDWLIPAALLREHSFDESRHLYEDWKFAIHLAKVCKVIYVDKIGTYYVKSNGTLSTKPWNYHRSALNEIFFEYSNSRFARAIFVALTYNRYINKLITVILNLTRAYKIFPS